MEFTFVTSYGTHPVFDNETKRRQIACKVEPYLHIASSLFSNYHKASSMRKYVNQRLPHKRSFVKDGR